MSPEAQRIAIATARGYKLALVSYPQTTRPVIVKPDGGVLTWRSTESNDWPYLRWDQAFESNAIPDYLNNRDAMHEVVVKVIPVGSHEEQMFLGSLGWNFDMEVGDARRFFRATAAQWAEAFLRVLGLWVEPPQPGTHEYYLAHAGQPTPEQAAHHQTRDL